MSFFRQAVLIAVTAVAVIFLPDLWKKKLPVIYDGNVEPGFEGVFQTFKEHYSNGIEPSEGGSAFVVYHKGKKVVDIWGGYADKQSYRPWKQDTLGNMYSTGKGVAAICIGMLADRGLLSYDDKVVKYWPEFGKHGKGNVTVKMLVSHQAAIPFPNETLTWDIFRDHEKLADVLADSVPQWEIGTGQGYHAVTMASFCSVLVYKVDPKHRTLGEFVHDELHVPFGIDIHFGLPKELFYRVARMEDPKYTISQWVELVQNPLMRAFFLGSLRGERSLWSQVIRNMGELSDPYRLNDPDNRQVEVPSAFGTATADGLARLYGILANGGEINGTKLMSKAAISKLKTRVIKGLDKVVLKENEWGPGTLISNIKIGKAFGHSGVGGQEGWANPELKLGYGFVTNTPTISLSENGKRYLLLRKSLYDCVQNLEK